MQKALFRYESVMIADNVLKILFLPIETGLIDVPAQASVLVINAPVSRSAPLPALPWLKDAVFQHYNSAAAQALTHAGYRVQPELPASDSASDDFDMVLLAAPKQRQEALYLIAAGLQRLRAGGTLLCAAANDAGGRRLDKDIAQTGLAVSDLSKYKCRVVWTVKTPSLQNDVVEDWATQGAVQPVCGGNWRSQPGIFGWDKIDPGSALLAQNLPAGLSGTGADFGCGYGFLSGALLEQNPVIKALYVVDNDYRAASLCCENIKALAHKAAVEMVWDDVTNLSRRLPPLDWIVMNPPFHAGKTTDPALGQAFIQQAAARLRRGGALWMVANAHLPYEAALRENFSASDIIKEEKGFKIFHARK